MYYKNQDGEWEYLGSTRMEDADLDFELPEELDPPISTTGSFSGKIVSSEEDMAEMYEFWEDLRIAWLAQKFPLFVWN